MSCNEIKILQGQDMNIDIPLYDQARNLIDGGPWKIVTTVKHANGTIIAKFSKNAASGFETMDVSNEAAGTIRIKLLSAHTIASPLGKLYQQTHLQITDGASTDDGLLDLISPDEYCGTIIKSLTGGDVLP
jgi:hypothetical protein